MQARADAVGLRRPAQTDLLRQLHECPAQRAPCDPSAAFGEKEGRSQGIGAEVITPSCIAAQSLCGRFMHGEMTRLAEFAVADGRGRDGSAMFSRCTSAHKDAVRVRSAFLYAQESRSVSIPFNPGVICLFKAKADKWECTGHGDWSRPDCGQHRWPVLARWSPLTGRSPTRGRCTHCRASFCPNKRPWPVSRVGSEGATARGHELSALAGPRLLNDAFHRALPAEEGRGREASGTKLQDAGGCLPTDYPCDFRSGNFPRLLRVCRPRFVRKRIHETTACAAVLVADLSGAGTQVSRLRLCVVGVR